MKIEFNSVDTLEHIISRSLKGFNARVTPVRSTRGVAVEIQGVAAYDSRSINLFVREIDKSGVAHGPPFNLRVKPSIFIF